MSDERIYPCDDCGVMRSKAEGGTLFTVCDHCWDKRAEGELPGAARDRLSTRLAEVERENEKLRERQQELLAAMVRVANETPFADEAKDALAQRGRLVAEIGTLRNERDAAIAERDAARADHETALRMLRSAAHVLDGYIAVCESDVDKNEETESDRGQAAIWHEYASAALAGKAKP